MRTILLSGGTGLIGSRLAGLLAEKGYRVIILTRNGNQSSLHSSILYKRWDITKRWIDPGAVEQANAVIHLAGANITEKRWTKQRRREIILSRTESSSLLIEAIKNIPNSIQSFISASAIGFYGEDNKWGIPFKESHLPGNDFLANVCKLWEQSVLPIEDLNIQLCILRTGIVLTQKGGALKEMMKPLKAGIAAIPGDGKQKISYISLEDLCAMYIYVLEQNLSGIFNAVAPQAISMGNLIKTVAKSLNGNRFIQTNIPPAILKISLGDMSREILKSTSVSSEKIAQAGFCWKYPTVESIIHASV